MFMTVSRANAWIQALHFCLAVQSQTACSCLSSARRMLATSIRWVRTSQTRRSSLWSQDFGNKGSWISVSSRPAWLCSETIFQKQPTPCGAHSSSGVAHALSAHLLPFTPPVWWAEAPLFRFCLDEHYLCSLAWEWGASGLEWGENLEKGRLWTLTGWGCKLALECQESVPVFRVCILGELSIHDCFTC